MLSSFVQNAHAISLKQFVTDVIQDNPQIRQQIHSYRQVVEDENIAGSGWLPSVDLSASVGTYKTKSPITGGAERDYESNDISLTLTQNLFNGFDTTYAEQQARARISSELNRVYDEIDNTAIQALGYYLDALKHRHLLELAERNVRSHEEILQQLHDRNFAGAGRISEEEQTIGRLAQAKAGLLAQRNNLEDALTRLHFALGRYVAADELENPEIPVAPEGELDALLDKALLQHPAMRSAQFNIVAAESNYERAKSKLYPRIDLQLQKLVGDDISGYVGATDDQSATINLTYNLYSGGADTAGKRKGVSIIYENRSFARKVRRQVIETTRLAWMASQSLKGQLKYMDEYVEKANKTSEFYRAEFLVGKRDLLDLLDVEGEFNTAMVRQSEAYHDFIKETFRVYEGMGELFKALGMQIEIKDENIRLVDFDVAQIDTLPYSLDKDEDKELDVTDHCDNTLLGDAKINQYGCHKYSVVKFKHQKIEFDDTKLIVGELKRKQLHFIYRSDQLTDKSFDVLKAVINDLLLLPKDTMIEIYAHTDNRGGIKYNNRLSQKRADSIKKILVLSGVEESRINAVGLGELYPIADNSTDEGRAKNRRVEFLVKKKEKVQGATEVDHDSESAIYPKIEPAGKVDQLLDKDDKKLFPIINKSKSENNQSKPDLSQ